jgi:hypothetical protein
VGTKDNKKEPDFAHSSHSRKAVSQTGLPESPTVKGLKTVHAGVEYKDDMFLWLKDISISLRSLMARAGEKKKFPFYLESHRRSKGEEFESRTSD